MKSLHVIVGVLSVAAIMVCAAIHDAAAREGKPVTATAEIGGCAPNSTISGMASLREQKTEEGIKQVRVMLMVKGLRPGKHAVHIHETAICDAEVACTSAGGHFDPGLDGNSSPDGNHPFHSGDLINIEVNKRGIGSLNTTTTRVTLSPGPLSLFDEDGSAFIIHVNPDTYCPNGEEAGCAGGGRAACGVIDLED